MHGLVWACLGIALFLGCGPGASSPPPGSGGSTALPPSPPPPPPGSARVNVVFTGNGAGHVTSLPPGIDCPGTCGMTVASGSSVSLIEQPDASSTFIGWGGACSGAGGCSIVATGDHTTWVHFEAKAPHTSSCDGIAAPDDVGMQTYVRPSKGFSFHCGSGVGDAAGTLAFTFSYSDPRVHTDVIDFVKAADAALLSQGGTSQGLRTLQQPVGLSGLSGPTYLGPFSRADIAQVSNFDSSGKADGAVFISGKGLVAAAHPGGGIFLAGDMSTAALDPSAAPPPLAHAAAMLTGGGTDPSVRWGPQPLASSGTVFGAGVDTQGRALVITAGPSSSGTISGQWFDRDGTALTGEFVLLSGFVAGASTWFETSPLIGGGLVVRRMDAPSHAHALVVVASGSASVQPAPAWMAARTDTKLQIARGGRAYAVLPFAASGAACTQRLELVAPDGTSCAVHDYPIAEGTCDTHDLVLGADGTILQQLPDSMEVADSPDTGGHTCTWRFWPDAVR